MVGVAADLLSTDASVRLHAVEVIAARSAGAIPELGSLVDLLGDPDRRVQRRAGEVLASAAGCDDAVAPIVDGLLASNRAAVRWGAAFCQARAGRASLAACVVWIEHLASADRDLRWAAHQLLVESAPRVGESAIAAVCRAASDGDTERRKMALYCLRDLGLPSEANASLAVAALAADDIGVRLAALAALPVLAIDPDEAARILCLYLDDADPRMRRATAAALGRLPRLGATAREALQLAARSPDASLGRSARAALAGAD